MPRCSQASRLAVLHQPASAVSAVGSMPVLPWEFKLIRGLAAWVTGAYRHDHLVVPLRVLRVLPLDSTVSSLDDVAVTGQKFL
jgi:hypothetical protein